MFNNKKITTPLVNKYCHGTEPASSIFLTTNGPKDHNKPANNTKGIAYLALLISDICILLLIILHADKFNIKKL